MKEAMQKVVSGIFSEGTYALRFISDLEMCSELRCH